MAGPWEKYAKPKIEQAQPVPVAAKPWEKYSQPKAEAPQEEPGVISRIGEMFTGSERQTRATEELPELQDSGVLAGLDIPTGKKVAAAAAISTMTNPEEIAKTLQSMSPEIGIQYDEKGNMIAANNVTGVRTVINKPGFTGADALNALQLGAAFTPAGRGAGLIGGGVAKQAAAIGAGSALTQGAIEGAQSAAGGEFNPEEIAAAGAVGAAIPIAAGAVGVGIDAAKRGVQAIRSAPGSSAPIVQAAERANIPLMTSDVIQPETFMGKAAQTAGERIPYLGTGGLRETQQSARQAAIRELGEQYPTPKPLAIITSLKDSKSRIKKAAGQRYDELVPKVDSAGALQYASTQKSIDDALAELSKPGVVSSKEAVQELEQFRDTLASAPQTYSTMKENRTALRDMVSSYDAQGRSQLPTRAKSMLDKVYRSMTSDMDEAARSALSPRDFSRLKEANAVYASEADKLTKTRLKNILDKGDLTPEIAEGMLFSGKPSEVRNLYNSLDTKGRDAARATIIQRAITKAGGVDDVSPEKFLSEMRRLQSQSGIVFKGDERRQLEGLTQVLRATKRAGQAAVQTASGQQLYPAAGMVAGSMIGSLGASLAAGGTIGGLARAYESAAVRNALIRIGSAPKSEASKLAALRLARELSAASQPGASAMRAQSPAE